MPHSIYPVLHGRVSKAKGTRRVDICVYDGQTRATRSMRIQVAPRNWNPNGSQDKLNWIRSTHPGYIEANSLISQHINALRAKARDGMSAEQVLAAGEPKRKGRDVFSFWERELSLRAEAGDYKALTLDKHRASMAKLRQWRPDLTFQSLTYDEILDYMDYAARTWKNKPATISKDLACLRVIVEKAISPGRIIKRDDNPFDGLTLARGGDEDTRRWVTLEEMDMLKDVGGLNMEQERALDIYLFQYFAGGRRISEVLTIRCADVTETTYLYTESKNRRKKGSWGDKIKKVRKAFIPQTLAIAAKYRHRIAEGRTYLFPVLGDSETWDDPVIVKRRTSSVNGALAGLARDMGIPTFTSHSARRAFSDHGQQLKARREAVSRSLGHSSERITQRHYERQVDIEDEDDSVRELTGLLFGESGGKK